MADLKPLNDLLTQAQTGQAQAQAQGPQPSVSIPSLQTPQAQPQIDLSLPQAPKLSTEAIKDRADRYHYAAGEDSPGPGAIYQQIQAGREADWRDYLARKQSIKLEMERLQMLKEVMAHKAGEPLTDQEFQFVQGLSREQLQDPDTVLEELQAKRQISDLYGPQGGSQLQVKAYDESAEVAHVFQDAAEQTITKRQIAYKLYEDIQQRQAQAGFGTVAKGWFDYLVAGAIPGLYPYLMHNVVQPDFQTGFLTGDNKLDQYSYLMGLPVGEYNKQLKAAADDLERRNPQLAMDFVSGLLGYSTSDAHLDNAFNLVDLAALGLGAVKQGARLIKAADEVRGLRAVRSLAEGGPTTEALQEAGLKVPPSASPDRSLTPEQAVGQLYRRDTPVDQIAEELQMTPGEVQRIVDTMESSGFATRDLPDDAPELGIYGTPRPQAEPQSVEDILKATQVNQQYAEALKNTIRATNPKKPDIVEIAASAGKDEEAAFATVVQRARAKGVPEDDLEQLQSLWSALPSWSDPGQIFRGAQKLTREMSDRIEAFLNDSQSMLLKALTMGVDDAPPAVLARAFNIARTAMKEDAATRGVLDAVLDLDYIPLDRLPEDSVGNVGHAVLRFGRPDGSLFKTKEEAENFIKLYSLPDARALASGQSWVVQSQRAVSTADLEAREATLTASTQTPRSWFTTLLDGLVAGGGKFRGPSETLSSDLQGTRVHLINQIAKLSELYEIAGAPVNKLTKVEHARLQGFLDFLRRYEDHLEDGAPTKGLELSNQGQLEILWASMYKRLPSDDESMAFWVSNNLYQYEYLLRNLDEYFQDARLGTRQWQAFKGTDYFDAIEKKGFDWSDPKGNLVVVDPKTGAGKFYSLAATKQKTRDALDALIKDEGYRLLWRTEPFTEDYERPVHFVLTKTAESRNLPFRRVPYRPGIHHTWDYNGYIKEPVTYEGENGQLYHRTDRTIWGFVSKAEASEITDALNEAKRLYREGNADFDQFVRERTPFDPDVLANKFKNGTLNPNVPAVAVRAGRSTLDTDLYKDLRTRSWSDDDLNPRKGRDRLYLGRRGLDPTGVVEDQDPVFDMARPKLIDPLPMLAQSLGKVSRHRMLQPMQLRAAEGFVEEFGPLLKNHGGDIDRMRADPLSVLYNPVFDTRTEDRQGLAAARAYQYHAKTLVGTSTEFGQFQNWLRTKLIDSVYRTLGTKASEVVYDNLWAIPDPINFSRQVAFHSKLGLLNPVQYALQYQTFTNTVAMSPRHAPAGWLGGMLMQLLGSHGLEVNEKFLNHFATIAAKATKPLGQYGWSPETFKEMYRAMLESGVFQIGPQHAYRSDFLDPDVFSGSLGKWLDKGTFFFTQGERANRMAAFATAFHEYRFENPLGRIDRKAMTRIMARQDDLSVNMTHASSSALQRGLGAVAGQFWTYQNRLLELLWGRRIAPADKVRVIATYAAMYGLPVTASAGLGYPLYDDVRGWVLKNGLQNSVLVEALTEGLPETLAHMAFGVQTNFGSRLGPNGIQAFKDYLNGDAKFYEILGGASASIGGDILKSTWPVVGDIKNYVTGEGRPHVTYQDFLSLASNVSTVNNAIKAYYAISAGKYLNKTGEVVDNQMTTVEGLLAGIMGLTPQRIDDVYIMKQALKGRIDAQQFARQMAKKYYKLGWAEKDPETAKEYLETGLQWVTAGDLSPQERISVFSNALSEYETENQTTTRQFQKVFPESVK